MSRERNETSVERILIALDANSDNWASMRSAVALAARLRVELCGVFIEDADLLRLAELPGAWEVMLWSAQERPLTEASMTRALKAFAAKAELDLARAAQDARVGWSFSVVRGPRIPALLKISEQSDVAIFSGGRRSRKRAVGLDAPASGGRGVFCLYSDSAAAKRGLRAAAALTRGLREGMVVMLAEREPQPRRRLRENLEDWIKQQDLQAKIEDISPEALLRVLGRCSGAALVLPADCAVLQHAQDVQQFLATVSCPVIVVR